MRIAFLTRKNPLDKGTWSGVFFKIFSELGSNNEIEWVKPGKRSLLSKARLTSLALWYKVISDKSLNVINDYYAKSTIDNLEARLKKGKFDVIFAAASPELIAYLKVEIPIVYFLDATFIQLSKEYPAFSNLPEWNHRQAMVIERKALEKADHIIVSSGWAKNSAIDDYNANTDKISVIGFGANLDIVPTSKEAKDLIYTRTAQNDILKILFIGKDWKRKGGELAFQTFIRLNDEGIKTQLTILGTVPPNPSEKYSELHKIIPHLNKNNTEDSNKIYSLFEESHILLLPTRADCTPIVFCEAASFGIPVITTDTGGIKDVVEDGITGKTLNLEDLEGEYVAAIKNVYLDKENFKKISMQSRDRFEKHLNWKVWGNKTQDILKDLISKNP